MGAEMFKRLRLFICSILLILTQISCTQEQGLLFEGLDGQHHTLNEYIGNGQWVVVNVWATACPYCRRELFDLASFHDRHHEKDAIVLGLTLDLASFDVPDKKHVTDFASTYLIDYPLLLVSGKTASKAIGRTVHTVPMTFFYNPKGKMVYQFTGELNEQILEDVIKNKNPTYRGETSKEMTQL